MEVNVFSFGYDKNGSPSRNGGAGVVVLERDLRDIPDPMDKGIRTNGESEEVVSFFKEAIVFSRIKGKTRKMMMILEEEKNVLRHLIRGGQKMDISEMRIYYGCQGGYQRSVFWSREIFFWIEKEFDLKVSLEHTSPLMSEK